MYRRSSTPCSILRLFMLSYIFCYIEDIIDLRNNSLTGTIPNNWNETHVISSLMVSHNNITGRLPDTLGRAPRLRKLHVSGNKLTGSIPDSYYNLSSLEELYLDGNRFDGGLPQTREPFYENMEEFSIHDNAFSGRFPAENFESSKLSEFNFFKPIYQFHQS